MSSQVHFEWNEDKAAANLLKHGVSFELASSVFRDPNILTVPDLDHSTPDEERWFSLGLASTGALLAVAYLWQELQPKVLRIRLITARHATRNELQQYQDPSS